MRLSQIKNDVDSFEIKLGVLREHIANTTNPVELEWFLNSYMSLAEKLDKANRDYLRALVIKIGECL